MHIDPASYSGILYLSRPEDCARSDAAGSDFFRHKRSGLEAVPTDPARIAASGYADANVLIEDVVNRDTVHAREMRAHHPRAGAVQPVAAVLAVAIPQCRARLWHHARGCAVGDAAVLRAQGLGAP
ncbi:MAG: hypothetical protein ACOVNS_05470, partial [Erythrobacter sp.]